MAIVSSEAKRLLPEEIQAFLTLVPDRVYVSFYAGGSAYNQMGGRPYFLTYYDGAACVRILDGSDLEIWQAKIHEVLQQRRP